MFLTLLHSTRYKIIQYLVNSLYLRLHVYGARMLKIKANLMELLQTTRTGKMGQFLRVRDSINRHPSLQPPSCSSSVQWRTRSCSRRPQYCSYFDENVRKGNLKKVTSMGHVLYGGRRVHLLIFMTLSSQWLSPIRYVPHPKTKTD